MGQHIFLNYSNLTRTNERLVQWSDEEDEDSGYASSATVSSVQIDRVSVNMTDNRNDDLFVDRWKLRSKRGRHDANSPSFSSLDPDYSPDLGQVLVGEEGVFRSTRSRVQYPTTMGNHPLQRG